MNQNEMVQSLRAEIAKLQRVLDLLLNQPSNAEEVRRPGRPKGSGNRATSFNPEEFAPRKRTISAEGKARIAAAQKKRWAAQKAATPDRLARKQPASSKRSSKTVPPKSARKLAPPPAKKSAGAGKRAGSTQNPSAKRAAVGATRENAMKKRAAKKTSNPATKRPARQVASARPGLQTTA